MGETNQQLHERQLICKRCEHFGGWQDDDQTIATCDISPLMLKRKFVNTSRCPTWDRGTADLFMGTAEQLRDYFDRVFVISLKRTPERLKAFFDRLDQIDWPFASPEVFDAIDGNVVGQPTWFKQGGGAWGCLQSHRRIIEMSLMSGAERILILEDDAAFPDDFAEQVGEFLSEVPAAWDCLMIGGQQMHDGTVTPVSDHVEKVSQCERTHCYALSASGMKSLYRWWSECADGHCDWRLGDWQELPDVRNYRAQPFLAYQAQNFSTIRCQQEPSRSWDAGLQVELRNPSTVPVVWMRCDANLIDELRRRALIHSGYWRDGHGVDHGLANALKSPAPQRLNAITRVMNVLRQEAAAYPDAVAVLWNGIQAGHAMGMGLPVLVPHSIEEAEYLIRQERRKTEFAWPEAEPVIFYHVACMNHWKDVVIEQLDAISKAGLHTIRAGVLGSADDTTWLKDQGTARGLNIEILFTEPELKLYEIPTLAKLQEFAKAQTTPVPVMYIHTKGVSQPDDPNKLQWRRVMQHALITQWKEQIEKLRLADLVGVDWIESAHLPHYSGNFWLARSDWITRLDDIHEYQQSRRGTFISGHPWERMCAEMWPGSKQWHHAISLVTRNENLWTGDAVFKFPPCSECGSPDHARDECPDLKLPVKPFGPGSVVHVILGRLGYKAGGGCGCRSFQSQMDSWGWTGCLGEHREEIVKWFTAKARTQGIAVKDESATALILAGLGDAAKRAAVAAIKG